MPYSPPTSVRRREILALAARTANADTNYIRPPRHVRGVRVYVNVTAASATPSVVFSIQTRDRNGNYHTLLASAAVTGVSDNVYEVYPGSTAVANLVASKHIGNGFRVSAAHADADSITYRISAEWLF